MTLRPWLGLAWFIAHHPGGVIAGSIAYRYHRVQMFEGYAKARQPPDSALKSKQKKHRVRAVTCSAAAPSGLQ